MTCDCPAGAVRRFASDLVDLADVPLHVCGDVKQPLKRAQVAERREGVESGAGVHFRLRFLSELDRSSAHLLKPAHNLRFGPASGWRDRFRSPGLSAAGCDYAQQELRLPGGPPLPIGSRWMAQGLVNFIKQTPLGKDHV